MERSVRLCMIGAGRHAGYNIYPCFRLLRNAEVVANADLDRARAERAARLHGLARSYTDYHEMLDAEQPDGVLVCVGPDFHARAAVELMRLGFHVYTEKPPGTGLAPCREVAAVQQETGRICMTAFKKRFAPAGARLKRIVADESFGAPSVMTILRTRTPGGDDLEACLRYVLDSCVHMTDLATWLFGPAEMVHALRHPPMSTSVLVRFRNGATGTFAFPTTLGNRRTWEEVTVTGAGGVLARMSNSTELAAYRDGQPFAGYQPEWCFGSCNSPTEMGFVPELQAFVDVIASGEQPEASIASVLPGMALLEAVLESVRSESVVPVEET